MVPFHEYFRSVEHIWLIWLVSVVVLFFLTRKALVHLRWSKLKRILVREEGAAYSLSYVMTFPIYVLVICLVIESTLLLIVKMGTVYAAYAGARSSVVWYSLDNTSNKSQAVAKTRQAVVHALAPFGSSSQLHAKGAGTAGGSSAAANAYYDEYRKYSKGGPIPSSYLTAKYRYVDKATSVAGSAPGQPWDADLTVTVTYEAPLHIPGIGRILGSRAPWAGASFFTYRIVSTATLQNEGPQNPEQSMGITYDSR